MTHLIAVSSFPAHRSDPVDFSVLHSNFKRVKAGNIKNPHARPEPQPYASAVIPMIFTCVADYNLTRPEFFAKNSIAKLDLRSFSSMDVVSVVNDAE